MGLPKLSPLSANCSPSRVHTTFFFPLAASLTRPRFTPSQLKLTTTSSSAAGKMQFLRGGGGVGGGAGAASRLFVRYFSKKRSPDLRRISPKVPKEEAKTISAGLYQIVKDQGPLSVGNAWNQVKVLCADKKLLPFLFITVVFRQVVAVSVRM